MLCPSCGEDTNPSLRYCDFCGGEIDLDFERIGAALAYEDEGAVSERVEQRVRGFLNLAIFCLVVVLLARAIVDRPVIVQHTGSFMAPETLSKDIVPVETLELAPVTIPLPR